MSRSRRHTPICPNTSSEHQKEYRTQENRAKRHRVKELLDVDLSLIPNKQLIPIPCNDWDYIEFFSIEMPSEKEYGNEWDSPRDGKAWLSKDLLDYCRLEFKWHKWLKK